MMVKAHGDKLNLNKLKKIFSGFLNMTNLGSQPLLAKHEASKLLILKP
jgi:hypothetical protein